MADESYPLIPQKYSLAPSFQTSQILWSSIANCSPSLLSLNLYYILFLFSSPFISKSASLEWHPSKLDSTKFDSSELDSDWKSSCSSQKSFSSLCFLKNLFFCWFSWSVFWCLFLSASCKVIWAKCYLQFLVSPIVRMQIHDIQQLCRSMTC